MEIPPELDPVCDGVDATSAATAVGAGGGCGPEGCPPAISNSASAADASGASAAVLPRATCRQLLSFLLRTHNPLCSAFERSQPAAKKGGAADGAATVNGCGGGLCPPTLCPVAVGKDAPDASGCPPSPPALLNLDALRVG